MEKSYPYNMNWEQIKVSQVMDKVNIGINVGAYGTLGVLFVTGVLGSQFLVSYVACSGTSYVVKKLVRKGVI